MMDISQIVFLGPSLDRQEASAILTADYRQPIRAGDLDDISPPAEVAIIDGVMDPEVRLPRSEAEHALHRGLRIYGAASTGALLAVELGNAGMIGTGRVFEFLRTVTEDRDDLVALLYWEPDYQPLTVPIINILLGCRELGCSDELICSLSCVLRAVPIPERSWESMQIAANTVGLSLPEPIRHLDAKANDARSLLEALRARTDISVV